MNTPTQTFRTPKQKQEELFKLPPRFVSIEVARQIVGSRRILERMIDATKNGQPWLVTSAGSGSKKRVSLIDYQSLMRACDRLLTELPPKLKAENKPDYQKEYYNTRTKLKREQAKKNKYDKPQKQNQQDEISA